MRILHYTLGLPPVRSGGLTKYAVDLMEEQTKDHEVIHLYPGNIDLLNKETRISKNKKITSTIEHYHIINSLPLPLFRGIKQPEDFMKDGPSDIYLGFLQEVRPDVIHIHTLMGIHKEFFKSAKSLGIRMVYTSHDYFGICPTINLYKDQHKTNCTDYEDGKGCIECCANAMGTKSLFLTQTPIYPFLRKLKKLKPAKQNGESDLPILTIEDYNQEHADKYVMLREFYLDILRKIDFFHFNSTVAESVFKEYLPNLKGKVVDITHSGIKAVKSMKTKSSKIRLGYLGPLKEFKGFNLLLNAFIQLPSDKYELHLYGDEGKLGIPENVFLHGRYSTDELEKIFSMIDALIVPSIWKETFGFVALEGLSHGTPIIVSENVGSKDLVSDEYGWKFSFSSITDLRELLLSLNKKDLYKKHLNIQQNFKVSTINEHCSALYAEIYDSKKVTL
ncbi:glycosyltransferase [Neobacillus niacini]|uniref:glycosyltransferase n=1 Tax=Neobacillus niacini TaxID=86668 RepID=UPI00203C1184|nr:glycosyltransferase [Neobacillus niacini]MCM3693173.1 glycosyltransferase [Neobacillus niacini]